MILASIEVSNHHLKASGKEKGYREISLLH